MDVNVLLAEKTKEGIVALYGTEPDTAWMNFQETKKEFTGDLTLVTFPFVKISKKNPEQTAQDIGNYLKENLDIISGFNVIKGFLNLSIKDSYWVKSFQTIHANPRFGLHHPKNEKVMVEYSSPNTNKPLHLGHIRNNLLGYSVAEILKAYGYDVIKVNLINDRGIHICKSMLAWQKFGNGETPDSSKMKGDHLVGKYYVRFDQEYRHQIQMMVEKGMSKEDAEKNAPLILEAQEMLQRWEAHDESIWKLWKMMNDWVYAGFDSTYKKLGVDFDKFYYESQTYLLGKELVEEGLQKNVFYKKEDGSVWVDLTADGLDEKLLLRADGTSVYMTQDLGTAQLKYKDFKMNRSVYVVGNEQEYHFKVLFLILHKLGLDWAKGLFHLSYGMVDLPSGKMKSREGTVVDADDLMEEMILTAFKQSEELGKIDDMEDEERHDLAQKIGMAALKYHLLKVDPKKRLLFDPNESIDLQGHTGPFIQYTYTRIRSVLRKAGGVSSMEKFTSEKLTLNEREVIICLNKFPDIIAESAQDYSPAILANYLYELAKLFNKFYHEDPVLKEEDMLLKTFRLHLCSKTAEVIERGMKCLGIEVPERM